MGGPAAGINPKSAWAEVVLLLNIGRWEEPFAAELCAGRPLDPVQRMAVCICNILPGELKPGEVQEALSSCLILFLGKA